MLTVLSVLLKKAVEWGVLEQMPCTIRLLRISKPSMGFYDFDEYERLVAAASVERTAYLIVLLGGEAGFRCGEIIALEWVMSISTNGSSVSNDPSGEDTSGFPRVDGYGTYR